MATSTERDVPQQPSLLDPQEIARPQTIAEQSRGRARWQFPHLVPVAVVALSLLIAAAGSVSANSGIKDHAKPTPKAGKIYNPLIEAPIPNPDHILEIRNLRFLENGQEAVGSAVLPDGSSKIIEVRKDPTTGTPKIAATATTPFNISDATKSENGEITAAVGVRESDGKSVAWIKKGKTGVPVLIDTGRGIGNKIEISPDNSFAVFMRSSSLLEEPSMVYIKLSLVDFTYEELNDMKFKGVRGFHLPTKIIKLATGDEFLAQDTAGAAKFQLGYQGLSVTSGLFREDGFLSFLQQWQGLDNTDRKVTTVTDETYGNGEGANDPNRDMSTISYHDGNKPVKRIQQNSALSFYQTNPRAPVIAKNILLDQRKSELIIGGHIQYFNSFQDTVSSAIQEIAFGNWSLNERRLNRTDGAWIPPRGRFLIDITSQGKLEFGDRQVMFVVLREREWRLTNPTENITEPVLSDMKIVWCVINPNRVCDNPWELGAISQSATLTGDGRMPFKNFIPSGKKVYRPR